MTAGAAGALGKTWGSTVGPAPDEDFARKQARSTHSTQRSGGNLRGSQGMGVVSDDWLDRVLLSILYMFKPSY